MPHSCKSFVIVAVCSAKALPLGERRLPGAPPAADHQSPHRVGVQQPSRRPHLSAWPPPGLHPDAVGLQLRLVQGVRAGVRPHPDARAHAHEAGHRLHGVLHMLRAGRPRHDKVCDIDCAGLCRHWVQAVLRRRVVLAYRMHPSDLDWLCCERLSCSLQSKRCDGGGVLKFAIVCSPQKLRTLSFGSFNLDFLDQHCSAVDMSSLSPCCRVKSAVLLLHSGSMPLLFGRLCAPESPTGKFISADCTYLCKCKPLSRLQIQHETTSKTTTTAQKRRYCHIQSADPQKPQCYQPPAHAHQHLPNLAASTNLPIVKPPHG